MLSFCPCLRRLSFDSKAFWKIFWLFPFVGFGLLMQVDHMFDGFGLWQRVVIGLVVTVWVSASYHFVVIRLPRMWDHEESWKALKKWYFAIIGGFLLSLPVTLGVAWLVYSTSETAAMIAATIGFGLFVGSGAAFYTTFLGTGLGQLLNEEE